MTSGALPQLPYQPRYNGPVTPLANIYSSVGRGSIRIVRILGFDSSGLLECQLQVVEITTQPYTAISYTWNPNASVWYDPPSKNGKPIRIGTTVVSVRDKVADILCLM